MNRLFFTVGILAIFLMIACSNKEEVAITKKREVVEEVMPREVINEPVSEETLLDSVYIVKPGDQLGKICQNVLGNGTAPFWMKIARDLEIENPDLIYPGDQYRLAPSKDTFKRIDLSADKYTFVPYIE